MAALKFVDQIYDNIHGYIPLTEVEAEIIKTPVFQRLRHVKQLGLVNLVFPGAEHSRFAHSLGVMHIVHRLTQALDPPLSEEDQQLLRVGALLHDIGHFPLSHAIEDVLNELLAERESAATRQWVVDLGLDQSEGHSEKRRNLDTKLHEQLGQTIIQSSDIAVILDGKVDPLRVAAIAMGKTGELGATEVEDDEVLTVMSQMLHSQVDADRIDYLLRDSSFSGLESGGFDLPKLYKEACWDGGAFGFRVSGLRAVEQFLMARLTNYRRIVFNKHVHAFEYMAKEVYRNLATIGAVPKFEDIEQFVKTDVLAWLRFNDHFFMTAVARVAARDSNVDNRTRQLAKQILFGEPMVELMIEERFCDENEWSEFRNRFSRIPRDDDEKRELARRAGVEADDLVILEAKVKVIDSRGKQPIYIKTDDGDFRDILDLPESIMGSLVGKQLFIRRLYALNNNVANRVRTVLPAVTGG